MEMENTTVPFYFNFTMFVIIGHYRYLAFTFCLLLYSFMVSANLLILMVILQQRTLHEPMYMFIALLSINALYGSAGFFPRFLMDLLSDTHLISRPACFTQIYVVYTYGSYELTILTIMAYDRYVAVCHPLHYHRKMSRKTVYRLAIFAWAYPTCNLTIIIIMVVRLPLCGNDIQKVFCASWSVVKLACISTSVNNAMGMLMAIITVFFSFFYILYTYLRIVLICCKKSAEFNVKVLQSCLPHMVSFGVYSIIGFCEIVLIRSNAEDLNPLAAVILSLEFVVIPPILNPLIYGLKLPEIRRHILTLLLYKR
ncbi:olfactory receptor 6N2-like [Mugil cephalus]|uniref:olfactory receptor 6N2-like n=1 Tax=Mugil cephalus TaxID=48193 RepID=UPI001FB7595D|nr:olfactory receptor 6N2-like [Mugil cephalus]